ncbi:putative invertase inhibitor [Juglans microcarpa x Juglans regia]|uniref:putative invertase inhibitor n=1 Tax=Juglans microcarpa x Juglans regia TaxID=2249226 RepID=UPI001B7F33FF|nr:putative invertase inhibitor [Juglans microcarpa x Juglans regia]
MKMVTYSLFLSLLFSISISISISIDPSSSYAVDFQPTKLVNKVCNQTSNYSFCVESLYTDSRTHKAERYELAYVAFRLASFKATSTKDHIAKLLKNNATAGQSRHIQRCSRVYKKAVSALAEAYGDLDSESFYMLVGLSNHATHAAADCQAALKGTRLRTPLTAMNEVFKVLCEICVAVSRLF